MSVEVSGFYVVVCCLHVGKVKKLASKQLKKRDRSKSLQSLASTQLGSHLGLGQSSSQLGHSSQQLGQSKDKLSDVVEEKSSHHSGITHTPSIAAQTQ